MLRRLLAAGLALCLLGALPALASPTIDGSGGSGQFVSASTGNLTISTSLTDDIVVVGVQVNNTSGDATTPVSAVSGAGLTWTRYFSQSHPFANNWWYEVWWARAPSALSGASITVTLVASRDSCAFVAAAIHGATNLAAPFDTNAGVPFTNTGNAGSTPTQTGVSTDNANDMILSFLGGTSTPSAPTLPVTVPVGFTNLQSIAAAGPTYYASAQIDYTGVSVLQSSATYTYGSALNFHRIVVAPIAGGAAATGGGSMMLLGVGR